MLIIHNIIKPVILPSNDTKNERNGPLVIYPLPTLKKPLEKRNF
jgi:hypothetical protein